MFTMSALRHNYIKGCSRAVTHTILNVAARNTHCFGSVTATAILELCCCGCCDLLKSWTTLGKILKTQRTIFSLTYMMVAFLEKSVSTKTVQKYFLVGYKSGVGFRDQKAINKFLTYVTVWWDIEKLYKTVFCVPGLHPLSAGTPNLHSYQKKKGLHISQTFPRGR